MLGNLQNKTNKNPWGDDHPEKVKPSAPTSIGFNDQLKGLLNPDSMFQQLFGEQNKSENASNQPIKEPHKNTRETLVFSHARNRENEEVLKESQVILSKLKEQINILEKSEKGLVSEISKVKVEQMPAKAGIYYLRFLEWLITVVRELRMKVEDGKAWLQTFNQRKKKVGYWKMYKKHGTTFGLSHERTLATQTG